MKHWDTFKDAIILSDERACGEILSLELLENGQVKIEEGCDKYFSKTLSPSDAIEALQEAIEWIKGQQEAK